MCYPSFYIYSLRRQEISIIRKKSAVLSGVAALEYAAAPMATLLSVITLILTGQPLTPANVFLLLCFMMLLRTSICIIMAYGLLETYEAHASLGRIEQFMLLESLPSSSLGQVARGRIKTNNTSPTLKRNSLTDQNQDVSPDKVKKLREPTALQVKKLTKKQLKREDEFILHEIDFTAKSGSLTVVTGPVGSGKSTLLSAIAGEIQDTSGTISCKGTLVYVPQIAWVFSGTIRENILFGEPYDETKYTRIIEACALTEDIQHFPDCDQTVVGERGEVLSGGQRARVSLARAVYADANIYLLDDPLSAVDFNVGQHIFEKCIKGLLGQKTRVITSHQEHHMKEANNVIVLYKGRTLAEGSFTKLKEGGILNTAVDPLYMLSKDNFDEESEANGEVPESHKIAEADEVKGLQISEEDRAVGVVSSKLYWSYFRSGVPSLVISAEFCLCLITQGEPRSLFTSSLR